MLKNLLLLVLIHEGLRQRNDHLCPVDAKAQRLGQSDFSGHKIPIFQQCPPQQHLYRQHVLVDLQRVFELDDGALSVLLLKPHEGVFIVFRGFAVGRLGAAAQRQAQAEQQTGAQQGAGWLGLDGMVAAGWFHCGFRWLWRGGYWAGATLVGGKNCLA